MDNVDCLIPSFQELTAEQISTINENSFVVKYKKNDTIFRQNMPISQIVFLKSGLVKVFKENNNDKNLILKIIPPNNFIDLLSPFCRIKYDFSATALVDCEVVFTHINIIRNVIKENGSYAIHLLQITSETGFSLLDKLMNLSHKQVPGRIAGILLFFAKEIFNNDEFEFPLTRQELADLISTTKESVSRTLSELKNDRIIDINDKKISIKSIELINTLIRIG